MRYESLASLTLSGNYCEEPYVVHVTQLMDDPINMSIIGLSSSNFKL